MSTPSRGGNLLLPSRARSLTGRVAARSGGARGGARTAPSWLFVLPALAVYAVVVLYPDIAGIYYAFTDWGGIGTDKRFVGLDNFKTLLRDERATAAISNTLLITLAIVVVQNLIGLLLALGVHARVKSRHLLRVIFFAPVVVSPVMVAFLWKYVYNPDGGLNALLESIGLGALAQNWLGDPSIALWSVAGMVIWQHAGYSMVIFLAGLESVPRELEEAALLDGAKPFKRFRFVVLPLLGPAITVNVILSTIGGLKIFDQVFAATNGGPGYATETLSTVVYKQAFVYGKFSYGIAMALVLAIFVAAISLVQLHFLRAREVQL